MNRAKKLEDEWDSALRERLSQWRFFAEMSCKAIHGGPKWTEACSQHKEIIRRANELFDALRDATRAEERAKDGPLLSCPWCSEDQRGRIAQRQIDHLIACGDRQIPAARAEQREASADLIYELAHSMAERGLFVRDGFGEPNILAIRELEAALRSPR